MHLGPAKKPRDRVLRSHQHFVVGQRNGKAQGPTGDAVAAGRTRALRRFSGCLSRKYHQNHQFVIGKHDFKKDVSDSVCGIMIPNKINDMLSMFRTCSRQKKCISTSGRSFCSKIGHMVPPCPKKIDVPRVRLKHIEVAIVTAGQALVPHPRAVQHVARRAVGRENRGPRVQSLTSNLLPSIKKRMKIIAIYYMDLKANYMNSGYFMIFQDNNHSRKNNNHYK